MFIELNYHWTHGKHPFDENNEDDLKILEKLKQLSKKSDFVKTAVYVWTELDKRKIQTAKSNHLNFKFIYDKEIYNADGSIEKNYFREQLS